MLLSHKQINSTFVFFFFLWRLKYPPSLSLFFRLCYLIACNFRLTNEINVHSLGLLPKTAFRKIFKNSLINIVSLGRYAAFWFVNKQFVCEELLKSSHFAFFIAFIWSLPLASEAFSIIHDIPGVGNYHANSILMSFWNLFSLRLSLSNNYTFRGVETNERRDITKKSIDCGKMNHLSQAWSSRMWI